MPANDPPTTIAGRPAAEHCIHKVLPVDERLLAGEPLRNYALRGYDPGVSVSGLLHSSNILYTSFRSAGLDAEASTVCRATREEFGRSGTAWGIKTDQTGEVSWELYYYQHIEPEPVKPLTIQRVGRVLDRCGFAFAWPRIPHRQYFSASFDMTADILAGKGTTAVHVYLDQSLASPPAAMSYRLDLEGLVLENAYFLCRQQPPDLEFPGRFFYDSVHFDQDRTNIDKFLWRELLPCDHLALAHKPTSDCIYYGGVTVDQLLLFFARVAFDPAVVQYVLDHQDDLAHLRFDVGVDLIGRHDGEVETLRAGLYGVL